MSSITIKNFTLRFPKYIDSNPTIKEFFTSNFFNKKKVETFTAVKSLDLEINAGDKLGIIGHNGAGKSSLLKAICSIYQSYDGIINIDGKIAPLLEIGAGFVPELSGRENIYLNGAILGFNKELIRSIEEKIISFAELEEFIDTPVKLYSTGMYMRLAFTIATSVKPDILILDEVFAGGDFSFMHKAKKRMEDLLSSANISVVVSHDQRIINSVCNRVIVMDKGQIIFDGKPEEANKFYQNSRKRNT